MIQGLLAIVVGILVGLCLLSMIIDEGPKDRYPTPVAHPSVAYLHSVQIAGRYWEKHGVNNRCAKVRLILVNHIASLIANEADGQALRGQCTMLIRKAWYRYVRNKPYLLCGLVIHEMGHLNGLGHSRNIDSVMYPVQHAIPNECYNL